MRERVQTGGLVSFDYNKPGSKLSEEKKKEIDRAYDKYYERRKREKKNRMIMWIIVVLILVLVGWIGMRFF